MEEGPLEGGAPLVPRPTSQRVAAAVVIAVLVLGFPLGIVIYSVGGESTRELVGAALGVMTGAVVLAWFYGRSRAKAAAADGVSEPK